jgi:hypothetical protein
MDPGIWFTWSNNPATISLTLESLRQAMTDLEKRPVLQPEIRLISATEAKHYREHGCNDYLCWVKAATGWTDADIDRALRELFGDLL